METRSRKASFEPPSPLIEDYLRRAGFYHAALVNRCQYEVGLIRALVERWRPETHTFHFPCGECTITLEDVALQLGLPIDGKEVMGGSLLHWEALFEELFGVIPPENFIQGSTIKMTWLVEMSRYIPEHATERQLESATRAYILRIIGGMLMPDKSGNRVHLMYLPLLANLNQVWKYSWGSACLGFLYRELCRATIGATHDIGGCLMLLQSWAWYRLPFLAPIVRENYVYPLALR